MGLNLSKKDTSLGSELRNEIEHNLNNCLGDVSKKMKDKIPEERLFEILRHLALLKFMANDENVENARKLAKLYKI